MYIILFNYTHTYIYIYIYMCMSVSRDHSYSNLVMSMVSWIYTPPTLTFNGLASPGERLSSRASWGTQYLGWSGMIRGLDGMGFPPRFSWRAKNWPWAYFSCIFHACPLIWCFGGCVCMCLLKKRCYFMIVFSRTKPEKNTQSWIQLLYVKTLDSQTVGNFWVKQKPTPVDLTIEIIPRPKKYRRWRHFPRFFGANPNLNYSQLMFWCFINYIKWSFHIISPVSGNILIPPIYRHPS